MNGPPQEFLEDVVPIINLQLTTPTLEGLAYLFTQYLAILNKARAPSEGEGGDSYDNEIEEGEEREGMEGEGGHKSLVEAGQLCHDVQAYLASEDPQSQV